MSVFSLGTLTDLYHLDNRERRSSVSCDPINAPFNGEGQLDCNACPSSYLESKQSELNVI